MLSILIPVYNYDIRPFVLELVRQSRNAGIEFEIRCYDDGSACAFQNLNRELEQMDGVIYKELPNNIGRSAIRNLLARDAAFPFLLFLDCDSFPEYNDFISRYIQSLQPGTLLYGGRTYQSAQPEKKEQYLRWKYGVNREVFSVQQRVHHPYHSFQTNNFVVPKSIFLECPLNETLQGYGHEDTQFGLDLMHHQIPIHHLDNPLRHLGLETTTEFLRKTLEGVKNLEYLISQGSDVSTIKLARIYLRIRKAGLAPLFRFFYAARKKQILRNLNSDEPSLRSFDLFKLGELLSAAHQRKRR